MKNLDLQTLHKLVIKWAYDRNLIDGSTPRAQFVKLMEEYGELCAGVARDDVTKIKDSIGDCLVVAIILREQLGVTDDVFGEMVFNPFDDQYEPSVRQWSVLHANEHLGRAIYLLLRSTVWTNKEVVEHINLFMQSLVDVCHCYDTNLTECLELAYDTIKDRKGTMVEGVFIKEEDL